MLCFNVAAAFFAARLSSHSDTKLNNRVIYQQKEMSLAREIDTMYITNSLTATANQYGFPALEVQHSYRDILLLSLHKPQHGQSISCPGNSHVDH